MEEVTAAVDCAVEFIKFQQRGSHLRKHAPRLPRLENTRRDTWVGSVSARLSPRVESVSERLSSRVENT